MSQLEARGSSQKYLLSQSECEGVCLHSWGQCKGQYVLIHAFHIVSYCITVISIKQSSNYKVYWSCETLPVHQAKNAKKLNQRSMNLLMTQPNYYHTDIECLQQPAGVGQDLTFPSTQWNVETMSTAWWNESRFEGNCYTPFKHNTGIAPSQIWYDYQEEGSQLHCELQSDVAQTQRTALVLLKSSSAPCPNLNWNCYKQFWQVWFTSEHGSDAVYALALWLSTSQKQHSHLLMWHAALWGGLPGSGPWHWRINTWTYL